MTVAMLVLKLVGMWCLLALLTAWCWTKLYDHE